MSFTYPFCYIPKDEIVREAQKLIEFIDSDKYLSQIFMQGKMLGVLIASDSSGNEHVLRAFSGLADGKSQIDGFVGPIFDTTTVPELSAKASGAESPTYEQVVAGREAGQAAGKERSAQLQEMLFKSYVVHNALGEYANIKDVFAAIGSVPPGGTGECCAPKLLEECYRQGWTPKSMGEFWYGLSPHKGEVRSHGLFYPSCTGKCGPLLSYMMTGLDVDPNPLQMHIPNGEPAIIYEDQDILVCAKPSGMLCVPGKTGMESLLEIMAKRACQPEQNSPEPRVFEVHRLDMDTSGIVVFAKSKEMQAKLRAQFETRKVSKSYIAHLVSPSISNTIQSPKKWKAGFKGTIALPIGFDYYDRPRHMVDFENGKQAITEFEILSTFPDGSMDVRFFPHTGRTHQLRIHSASAQGLGHPIQGDRLYGNSGSGRLMLHAESLSFEHPRTAESLTFTCQADW